jgi:glutathione synthase/RimK-type ligase-like ATP-grasp enzyme
MVNVLIPTQPDDTHALYVKQALEKKGHMASLWYTADFPQQQIQTFKFNDNDFSWAFGGVGCHINSQNKFDTVWMRRPRKPVLSNMIHKDDYENVSKDVGSYFKNILNVIEPNAFWINPVDKLNAVNCKLKQLKVAKEIGLNIPKTLVSNDVDEIKTFINSHKEDEVIYKTLYPAAWREDDGKSLRLAYTRNVTLEHLPSDPILQNTTGIFQKKINKAYELRITYMGNCGISAKIRSQEHERGIMDWRYIPTHELVIEPYILSDEIHKQCLQLMKKFGIVFGCFDFIVTPEEEYYFLEVNEQGQFLWIEEVNPEIKLLDAFTEFLISSSEDFAWKQSERSVSLESFSSDVILLQKEAVKMHIDPGTFC